MSRRNRSSGKRASQVRRGSRTSDLLRNRENLAAYQEWFLGGEEIFAKLKFHGNTSWQPSRLVWLAVLWSWSERRHLTDAFMEAVEGCRKVFGNSPLNCYQGFLQALGRWTSPFMAVLWPLVHARMQEIGGKFWRRGRWVPIAFDGSRSSAPRTEQNEQAFCAPNYGLGNTARYRKKKTKGMRRKHNQKHPPQPQKPQAWITLMWHMGLRLAWTWRLGPSSSSERAHVMDMLEAEEFPKDTLFCGDAGFVGYPLWSKILDCGGDFLVRVGANVDLLTETANCQFLKGGIVLCWPKAVQQAHRPPLRLRLVRTRIGLTRVWMLTSVLNSADLTVSQMVRFYKMRWGIEVEFRGLKQTLDRAKLRSHNPQRLLAELHWSIMAMTIAELFALKEQLARRGSRPAKNQPRPNPEKRSLAQTMRAIRKCLRNLDEVPTPGRDLAALLRAAVTDSYQRTTSKKARYRPPNPDKKPLGDPSLRALTTKERKHLKKIASKTAV